MDEKEIKSLLKSAREAIQNKEFNNAAKICEQILRAAPSNYTALVFAGRCQVELGNPTSAREFYNRAIAVDESQLLAWQGLFQLHEKYFIWDENCISCLRKLIQLTSDEKKNRDYRFQLATILAKADRVDESADEFLSLSSTDENSLQIGEAVIQALGDASLSINIKVDLVKSSFLRSIQNVASDDSSRTALELKFFRFLIKNRCWTEAYQLCSRLNISEDSDADYLCNVVALFSERYMRGLIDDRDEEMLRRMDELCGDQEHSATSSHNGTQLAICSLAVSGMIDLIDRNWTGILDLFDADKLRPLKSPFLWFTLAEAKFRLHDYLGAAHAAEQAQLEWKNQNYFLFHRVKAAIIEASALTEIGSNGSLGKALDIYNRALSELHAASLDDDSIRTKIALGIAMTLAMQGKPEAAQESLDGLSDRSSADYNLTVALVNIRLGNYVSCKVAVEQLRPFLDDLDDEDTAKFHYINGKMLWDTGGDEALAMKEFLAAAKLDSNYADAFYHMGLYYDRLNSFAYNEKALKCYERAYSLAGRYKSSIGIKLSDGYRKSRIHEKNLALLLEITESHPVESCTCAWLRLGLEYLSEEKADDAIRVLQTVLRVVDNDIRCLECLGEAYALRGSYAAALRTFEKVLTLEADLPKLVYAKYRMAMVSLVMRRYEDSVAGFRGVLALDQHHLPAVVGLGRALVESAKFYFSQGRYRRSLDTCAEAFGILVRAVTLDHRSSSAWHLLGVVVTFLTHYEGCYLENLALPGLEQVVGDGNKNEKNDLMKLGSRFFAQAIRLDSKVAQIWHDLGMNMFFQAVNPDVECRAIKELVSQSLACFKHALQLDPTKPRFWLSLANIATSQRVAEPELAQHCFIKSLALEPHQPAAWTGLGCLYKKFDEVELSHKCFQKAQSIDPDYSNCWIGQAVIAEEVKPEEALDLFRHALELGHNPQALVGYGYHVLTTALALDVDPSSPGYQYAIERLHAAPVAQIALQKYCWLHPTDSCASNLLALILEKEKMLELSGSTYLKTLDLLKESPSDSSLVELVTGNACRLFGKLGNSAMMRKLASKMTPKSTFENFCMRALAFYRLGQFDKAAELYSESTYMTKTKMDQTAVDFALSLIAAKRDSWKENSTLLAQNNGHDYEPLIFWSSICDLLEKGKLDMAAINSGLLSLSELPDAMEWQALIATVCCLYCEQFTLLQAQWLLHHLPFDRNVRWIFHYALWKSGKELDGNSPELEIISSLGRWRALLQMRNRQEGKEIFYSKTKHRYPDLFL